VRDHVVELACNSRSLLVQHCLAFALEGRDAGLGALRSQRTRSDDETDSCSETEPEPVEDDLTGLAEFRDLELDREDPRER